MFISISSTYTKRKFWCYYIERENLCDLRDYEITVCELNNAFINMEDDYMSFVVFFFLIHRMCLCMFLPLKILHLVIYYWGDNFFFRGTKRCHDFVFCVFGEMDRSQTYFSVSYITNLCPASHQWPVSHPSRPHTLACLSLVACLTP